MRTLPLVLLPVLLGLAARGAGAEEEGQVLRAAGPGPVLDGRMDEEVWAQATPVACEALEDGTRPEVWVLLAGNRLHVAATVSQPPGPGVGLVLMLAPEGAATAADAVAVGFAPQSVSSPRWLVCGPRGAGREIYRAEGAVDVSRADRWSVEVSVPLVDLGLEGPRVPLRLAVAVKTRAPFLVAWAPPAAAWRGPATWLHLLPAEPWPRVEVPLAAAALLEADRRDEERLAAWSAFVSAYRTGILDLLTATGRSLGADGPADRQAVRETLHEMLLEPLARVQALRPDLAYAHVVRGGVLHEMGLDDEARAAYARALDLMPGLGEARFGIHLDVLGPRLAAGPVGMPTDYEAAFAAARPDPSAEGFAAEGRAFATGLLHLAHGDFVEAVARLEPLAERYPFQQSIVYAASRARLGRERWPIEMGTREAEAKRADLPRVRLATSKGDILLELYEDDAANTVKNFVWLAEHGFYDGAPVARTVPFFLAEIGAGDPGWAIATLRPPDRQRLGGGGARRRLPWRGTVVMLAPTPDAAAARFALLTGTAPDLESDLIPFGRVVEGLDVLDALTAQDRIEKATVVRTRPGTEYRPLTVEGAPAPTPR